MAESIVKAVYFRSKTGKEEELSNRLRTLVQASRLDAGVTTFDLHRSAEDPASWFLYERYESEEHFNQHSKNPIVRTFLADGPTLLDGKLEVKTFKVIDV